MHVRWQAELTGEFHHMNDSLSVPLSGRVNPGDKEMVGFQAFLRGESVLSQRPFTGR